MSFFDEINNLLQSSPFKSLFPVQALAQGATQGITGMNPLEQYGAGAAGGAGIAGLGALMGGGAGAGAGMAGASGGGMSPSLSLFGPGTGQTAFGASMADSSPMGASTISKILGASRLASGLGGGGQQQQPAMQRQNTEQLMRTLYQMFPNLSPGGGSSPLGGSNPYGRGGQPWQL